MRVWGLTLGIAAACYLSPLRAETLPLCVARDLSRPPLDWFVNHAIKNFSQNFDLKVANGARGTINNKLYDNVPMLLRDFYNKKFHPKNIVCVINETASESDTKKLLAISHSLYGGRLIILASKSFYNKFQSQLSPAGVFGSPGDSLFSYIFSRTENRFDFRFYNCAADMPDRPRNFSEKACSEQSMQVENEHSAAEAAKDEIEKAQPLPNISAFVYEESAAASTQNILTVKRFLTEVRLLDLSAFAPYTTRISPFINTNIMANFIIYDPITSDGLAGLGFFDAVAQHMAAFAEGEIIRTAASLEVEAHLLKLLSARVEGIRGAPGKNALAAYPTAASFFNAMLTGAICDESITRWRGEADWSFGREGTFAAFRSFHCTPSLGLNSRTLNLSGLTIDESDRQAFSDFSNDERIKKVQSALGELAKLGAANVSITNEMKKVIVDDSFLKKIKDVEAQIEALEKQIRDQNLLSQIKAVKDIVQGVVAIGTGVAGFDAALEGGFSLGELWTNREKAEKAGSLLAQGLNSIDEAQERFIAFAAKEENRQHVKELRALAEELRIAREGEIKNYKATTLWITQHFVDIENAQRKLNDAIYLERREVSKFLVRVVANLAIGAAAKNFDERQLRTCTDTLRSYFREYSYQNSTILNQNCLQHQREIRAVTNCLAKQKRNGIMAVAQLGDISYVFDADRFKAGCFR